MCIGTASFDSHFLGATLHATSVPHWRTWLRAKTSDRPKAMQQMTTTFVFRRAFMKFAGVGPWYRAFRTQVTGSRLFFWGKMPAAVAMDIFWARKGEAVRANGGEE